MINYWIDKKRNFGHGKDKLVFGDKIPEGLIEKKRLEKFKDEGSVGEFPIEAAAQKNKDKDKDKDKKPEGTDK